MNSTIPGVYQNATGSVVIAVRQTAATVYTVEASDSLTHEVVGHKADSFFTEYRLLPDYPVGKAAGKFLDRKQFTSTAAATAALKELIMKTATVIVVSPTATFIGRFADVDTAADLTPSNSLLVTQPSDFEDARFTKDMLAAALGITQPSAIKKATKSQLAADLFQEYQTRTVTVIEPERPARKAKATSSTPRKLGAKPAIRAMLTSGEKVSIEALSESLGCSPVNIRTALSDLKSEKYCGEGGPLAITSAVVDSVRMYFIAQ